MHDTLGQISGACTSPQLHQCLCIRAHPLTSLQMGHLGLSGTHNTHACAHTHGKTKSHRVPMYLRNSHALLLLLSKFYQLF